MMLQLNNILHLCIVSRNNIPSLSARRFRATLFKTTQYIRSFRWRFNRARLYSVAVDILPASYVLTRPALEDTNIL